MLPKKNICCSSHNSAYTNFCLSQTCVTPLCPACIGEHSAMHDKLCTKTQIVMFQEAMDQISLDKTERVNQMKSKLSSMKTTLSKIKQYPQKIRQTISSAKHLATQSLQTLFNKLQATLLKQHQKQSYKSTSQLTKLISSIQQILLKLSASDFQSNILMYKVNKDKDNFKKSLSFMGQSDFSSIKFGTGQLHYHESAEVCLKEFVERCLGTNKGKENEKVALVEASKIFIPKPDETIFDLKSHTSKYSGEPFVSNQYSFSERINKSQKGIMDSSNQNFGNHQPQQQSEYIDKSSVRYLNLNLEPTGELKFPTLNFDLTPGFSLMKKQSIS